MSHTVFVIEDHEMMRETICALLQRNGFRVSGQVDCAEAALGHPELTNADLILVDTSLPTMNGIELVEDIVRRKPDARCLMFSGHGERSYIDRALAAGASGYLMKGKPGELVPAIQKVIAGETYLSREGN